MHDRRSAPLLATLAVCAAAALPLLSTLNAYFIGDDFGLIQLFAPKPTFHFLTLFTRTWTETIYGPPSDELRPLVELSYQIDSLWGPGRPFGYHLDNVVLHVLNALLVLAIARHLCRLVWPSAAFAGMVFAVLPVQAEVGAWISGRADSLPALCFLLCIFAYGCWRRAGAEKRKLLTAETRDVRDAGHHERAMPAALLYGVALLACFLAHFSKQSAIVVPPALVAYDVLLERRQPWRSWRSLLAYAPFVLVTVCYLGLRRTLFGNLVRESQIDGNILGSFALVQATYVQMLATGSLVLRTDSVVQGIALVGLGVALLAVVVALPAILRGRAPRRLGAALYFGPVWWMITVAPLAVTYVSGRHLYLTAAGFAIVLGCAFDGLWTARTRSWRAIASVAGAVLLACYTVSLHGAVEEWNRSAARSQLMLEAVWREAAAATSGSLILVGAPASNAPVVMWRGTPTLAFAEDAPGPTPAAWSWILSFSAPFMYGPPFAPTDLTARVAFVESPGVYCCPPDEWFRHTQAAIRAWHERGDDPSVVALTWDDAGVLTRRTDDPKLRAAVARILEAGSPDEASILLGAAFAS
ncbi:MAG: protein O-mannosyl-transferase [Chloroflexota bacterium]|jgi:hypothetical protein|nr:protein O-mannosyl-transferase [Chloroflexota bacterium]